MSQFAYDKSKSNIVCRKYYIMWIVKFRPDKVKKYNNVDMYHKKKT